jgi:methylase of polypeptide subunit release factors
MGALFWIHALSLGLVSAPDCLEGRSVAELGCGTGAAGIALLKILGGGGVPPTMVSFLDNDPEALELCRINCQQNQLGEYPIQLQQPWADLSSQQDEAGVQEEEDFAFDTILATDVLYDLKIIRPFLQTASRFLKRSNHNKPYLVLSHVPRWFLPRKDGDVHNNNHEPYNASQALEDHILNEAEKFGFRRIQTVRPTHVKQQCDSSHGSIQPNDHRHSELLESLQEMEEANAVLWVLELGG